MYFHVLIETTEKLKNSSKNKRYFELDKTNLLEIEEDIILPYLQEKEFQFDGYFLKPSDIARVVVKSSANTTKEYSEFENAHMSPGLIMYISPKDIFEYENYLADITKTVFKNVREKLSKTPLNKIESKNVDNHANSKIFIVHGQDESSKIDVARFVEKLGFEAIILHEQANSGTTIIEKIEKYTDVGFGIVIYTPCDVGAKKGEESKLQERARQNVVFEHGYLIAKLGRRNVCALIKGKIETPNDISGVVYIPLDDHKAWKIPVAKELRNSGYNVDMNLII